MHVVCGSRRLSGGHKALFSAVCIETSLWAGQLWNYGSILGRGKRCLLGAFAKVRKAAISFVVSVRMQQIGSHWTDFLEI